MVLLRMLDKTTMVFLSVCAILHDWVKRMLTDFYLVSEKDTPVAEESDHKNHGSIEQNDHIQADENVYSDESSEDTRPTKRLRIATGRGVPLFPVSKAVLSVDNAAPQSVNKTTKSKRARKSKSHLPDPFL